MQKRDQRNMQNMMAQLQISPFFTRGDYTENNTLAILSLKRDQQLSLVLQDLTEEPNDAITNTRFGSFPHSTLLNKPWGSQIIAVNVNANERDAKQGRKRKRQESSSGQNSDISTPVYEAAARGFAHILPPTPELWTVSLPHRTQVVYTPDYSLILQRLRARPGATIIEAGAGSGSFTHAAARAVFSGYPRQSHESLALSQSKPTRDVKRLGKVCSFEYHEPRAEQLRKEIEEHGLDRVVTVTHRDVYEKGFLLADGTSPMADMIFLDLPEPRRALQHLTRVSDRNQQSALNNDGPVRLCTFSPCIEQVQQTVEALERLGWVEISTLEVQHKRIDVRRDLIGLQYEGLRGVNASSANVEEAVGKLKDVAAKVAQFHGQSKQDQDSHDGKKSKNLGDRDVESKLDRLERIKAEDKERKVWREGRLVHRTEPELKTHTSYLTFAVLPLAWTDEDEARASQQEAC